jgi:putative MFS transporter
MAVPLLTLWLFPEGPAWFVIVAFCVYAFASGGPSLLEWVYPNEIFPTEVRATAVGIAVRISRIGAATGTYLMPIGAVITVAGFVVCFSWAPETTGRHLEDVAGLGGVPSSQRAPAR